VLAASIHFDFTQEVRGLQVPTLPVAAELFAAVTLAFLDQQPN